MGRILPPDVAGRPTASITSRVGDGPASIHALAWLQTETPGILYGWTSALRPFHAPGPISSSRGVDPDIGLPGGDAGALHGLRRGRPERGADLSPTVRLVPWGVGRGDPRGISPAAGGR